MNKHAGPTGNCAQSAEQKVTRKRYAKRETLTSQTNRGHATQDQPMQLTQRATDHYRTSSQTTPHWIGACNPYSKGATTSIYKSGDTVQYAGKTITRDGAEENREDTQALTEFPRPTTRSKL